MTANHCGIDAGNAGSLVVYWKFENSVCRQPLSSSSGASGDGVLGIFNSGSNFLSGFGDSDFTLVELDDPVDPLAEPYMPGWSIESIAPDYAIGVHHPNTDEKRISFDDDPGTISAFGGGSASTHVQVLDWDVGTTEPGSSGSPLFNQNSRVVGQLHGGGAACGNDLSDYYGWTAVSWTGGGTPATRLSDWLDPDALGALVLDGKSCAFSVDVTPAFEEICLSGGSVSTYTVGVSDNFSAPVNLSMPALPAGISASFSPNPVAPGMSATLSLSSLALLSSGTYNFAIEGTDGVESGSTNLSLEVYEIVPAAPNLMAPIDNFDDASLFPFFDWEDALHAKFYEIEVATDAAFTDIIYSAVGVVPSESTGALLEKTTTYYWRVRTVNTCGDSQWSAVFSFTTADFECEAADAIDLPIGIDGGPPNIITSTLSISTSGAISDLNVLDVNGTHTWLEDLEFELTSPIGTTVTLLFGLCGDEDNFNVSFDDQATDDPPCPYNDGGTYLPFGSLADFNGEDMMGTWTLQVRDMASGDGGALDGWRLEICSKQEADTTSVGIGAPSVYLNQTAIFPNPANEQIYVQLPTVGLENGSSIEISLTDISGRLQFYQSGQKSERIGIATASLPNGVYSLQLKDQSGTATKKIIIQH